MTRKMMGNGWERRNISERETPLRIISEGVKFSISGYLKGSALYAEERRKSIVKSHTKQKDVCVKR